MSAATPPTVPPLRPTLRQRAFSERTVRTLKRRRIVSGLMLVVLIGAAVLLASDAASYMTGQIVFVNGGGPGS